VGSTNVTCHNNLLLGFVLLACGIGVLVWPDKIQQRRVRSMDRHPTLDKLNPFSDWIRTPSFVVAVRVVGFVVLCFSFLLFYFAWLDCFG
jgi:hypothetical protein